MTALTRVYTVTFNLVRRKVINNVNPNDVSLGQIHQQLTTDFEKINARLDKLLDMPLKSAHIHMESGLNQLRCFGHTEDAKRSFNTCLEESIHAFNSSESFKDKATATRLRIMCILFKYNYFFGQCNMEFVRSECRAAVTLLVNEFEVRSSIRDEFENSWMSVGSFSAKTARKSVFGELASLKACVSQFDRGIFCDLVTSKGTPIELRNVAPIKLKTYHDIKAIAANGERLYLGTKNGLKVYETVTYTEIETNWVKSSEETGEFRSLAVYDNKICAGSGRIAVWDAYTFKEIGALRSHLGKVVSVVCQKNRIYTGMLSTLYDVLSSVY